MPGKVYKKNKDIVTRKIADELFLVPIKGKIADMQRIFTLNPVGQYIWQEIDNGKGLDEIHKGIIERFDVENEQADSDIREFIAELIEADLIRE
jgi:hypothetical protein